MDINIKVSIPNESIMELISLIKGTSTPKVKSQEISKEDEVTIEQVRENLAALATSGKKAEMKSIIRKYNGEKLTDIAKEDYVKIIEEVRVVMHGE